MAFFHQDYVIIIQMYLRCKNKMSLKDGGVNVTNVQILKNCATHLLEDTFMANDLHVRPCTPTANIGCNEILHGCQLQ